MNRLYIPAAVTIALIIGLSTWEGVYSDRFTGSSVTAAEFGKLFANLPREVGAWQGEDHKVDDKTLEVAGAVNHVSRTYKNMETGEQVDLWLVVGHSRDICRHTPDICYPSHGFAQDGSKQKQTIETSQGESTFYTARFRQEMALGAGGAFQRVFWAWNPNTDEEFGWEAPDNQRVHFGNNRSLYKMYFTATMKERDEPVADNLAMDFAKVMLPVVNHTLFAQHYGPLPKATPAGDDAAGEPAGENPADVAASVDKPAALPSDAPAAEGAAPEAPATP
ncbi:MAG: exosortase-associated EpsI family protein [Pirellulales bacterium]|nr:exosortase-associated EpsI family protein [Pirellulales bacterium]